MKPLIITNHSLQQYASRTGRNPMTCVAELINSVRSGVEIKYEATVDHGFPITRKYKGDTYYLWYDPKVDDELLAIIAPDGAIKTVLRKDIYVYRYKGAKERFDLEGKCFDYDFERKKRKSNRGV